MTNTEIKNQIINLQKNNPESILADICEEALNCGTKCENLADFLKARHRDLGIKYNLDEPYFTVHLDEIQSLIKEHFELAKQHINIETYVRDASWFAYQTVLQNLLVELESLVEKDAQF